MGIRVEHLVKSFGTTKVVNDVSFEVQPGELVALLGPSGGGKSTVLRMIAGLEAADAGEVWLDGERVDHLHARDRQVGFVFQHYALFRHMTVAENIAFGLSVRGVAAAERRERVTTLLEVMGLQGLGDRMHDDHEQGDEDHEQHGPRVRDHRRDLPRSGRQGGDGPQAQHPVPDGGRRRHEPVAHVRQRRGDRGQRDPRASREGDHPGGHPGLGRRRGAGQRRLGHGGRAELAGEGLGIADRRGLVERGLERVPASPKWADEGVPGADGVKDHPPHARVPRPPVVLDEQPPRALEQEPATTRGDGHGDLVVPGAVALADLDVEHAQRASAREPLVLVGVGDLHRQRELSSVKHERPPPKHRAGPRVV